MVSKCHNPHCSAPFRYFGDGKLFEFTADSIHETSELYWLCDACIREHTLERSEDGAVVLAKKQTDGIASRSDSTAGAKPLERAS